MSEHSAPSVDFDGRWYNQHKSHMDVRVDKEGNVLGEYVTKVGAPADEEHFPLVGHASGDQIAFAVNFGKYGSLTAWVGQLTDKDADATIITYWHLTKNVPDTEEPENQWASVLTGCDVFTRSLPKSPALARSRSSHPQVRSR